MPIITFVGTVHPIALQLTAQAQKSYKCKIADIGLNLECLVVIVNGAISVICEVDRYSTDDIAYILKEVIFVSRAFVNSIAFAKGDGVTVAFDGLIDPQSNRLGIVNREMRVVPLCTAYNVSEHLSEVMDLVMKEPGLAVALDDLVQAITAPRTVPVNCARSVEALRHLFSTVGAPRHQAWAAMRSALQISEEYVSLITSHSVAPRHGDVTGIDADAVTSILQRSWTIMDRFIALRRRGLSQLPSGEFPML
jgi:hypothetical protein